MRISDAIVSIGLLVLAVGLSPAVSFDGTRTPEGATVAVPLPDVGRGLNSDVNDLGGATPLAAVPVARWPSRRARRCPRRMKRSAQARRPCARAGLIRP